jgi:hypothetical protein
MDVTNPGLVNVADQAYGNPSTAVQSLAIPEDSDVLVPVADEGHPRAEDVTATEDGGNSAGPTPTSSNTINQPPASPSQSSGQLPGVPPAFLPFPQTNIVNTVANQQASQNEIQPASFDVIGVGSTIQTNQTAGTSRSYTVTSVQDANGGPVIDPVPHVTGNFSDVFDGGTGKLIFLVPPPAIPPPLPPELSAGAIIAITGATVPSYNNSQTVLGDLVIGPGSYTDASKGNPGGTVTTFSSPVPFPPALVNGLPVSIAGSNPYGGTRRTISNVISLNPGTFDEIADAGSGQITVISHATPLPLGMAAGKIVKLSGAYAAAGAQAASKVVNDTDTIASVTSVGGGTSIRIHSANPLPADLLSGQMVTIASADYNGTYPISNVTAHTFDMAVAFVSDEVGTWTAYTFNLPIAYATSYPGTWTCNTFDMAVNFVGAASGSWTSYTFTTPGNFAGDASGGFKIYVNSPPPTSVFRLGVAPADLQSFGVTMIGREITFGKAIITVPNRGASRLIDGCGPGFVTIDKTDFSDPRAPVLADPVPGDVFTLSVQRQGPEATAETFGSTEDVTIFPAPIAGAANHGLPPVIPGMPSRGPIEISTGPQPGRPIITGGVQVPTATTVNVADQATSVGLPANVYV